MRASRRRLAQGAVAGAAAAAGSAGAGWAAWNFLTGQARAARSVIPHRTDNAPNGDGLYEPGGIGPSPVSRTTSADIHLMVFGDSTAAGLGVDLPTLTPGAQLARKLADHLEQRVRLSTKAIVGATSRGLEGQVDAMLVAGPRPDVALILVGANDVTALHHIRPSARRLGDAVARLHEAGCAVVVGTCPDLGVVTAIPQPLRAVIRQYSLRLAAAQSQQVRTHGGRPVPLAELLADQFRAAPERMFSADNYHPSAVGYEAAADTLLPDTLAAIGAWGEQPLPQPPITSDLIDDSRWVTRLRKRFTRAPAHNDRESAPARSTQP
nr:SGNH/GDSL hydrolase family protein [Williamsia sterculiae]